MVKIFINYRREDSSPYVGRLVDHLEVLFKDGEVFRDIKSIVPGEDFKKAIDEAIQSFDYILVMIGPAWLSILKERVAKGTRDFVRLEIVSAFKQGKKVIPVLVGGASMPAKKELPKDIATLHKLHGIELTDSHFKNDIQRLVETMGGSKGTFKLFFEFPFSLGIRNEPYLLVVLKGPNYARFWNVETIEKTGVVVWPTSSLKTLPVRTWKLNLGVVEKPIPEPSFLDLNLRSGHYKLMVNLKRRGGKSLRPDRLKEQCKSVSFDLRNGETVAFKTILKSEHDVTQTLTHKLELESF